MHGDPRAPATVSRHVSPCAAPVLLPPRVGVPRGAGGDEVPRTGDSQDQGAAHGELRGVPRAEVSWPEEPTSYICVSPLLTVARCWMETELVPRLEEVEECQQLPREVCTPRPRPPCPRPSVLLSVLSLLP